MNEEISLYEIQKWLAMDYIRHFHPEPGEKPMVFVNTPQDMLKQGIHTRGDITVTIEYHAAKESLRAEILTGVDYLPEAETIG